MLGKNIDYWLLRPFVHKRNLLTEEELDKASKKTRYSLADAEKYIENIRVLYGNNLTVDPNLSYLDIGCGMGRFCLGIVQAGAVDVTGIDVVPRNIEQARTLLDLIEGENKPEFICTDFHSWQTERQYDIITVLGVMEHMRRPQKFLELLPALLKTDGKVLIGHENFFGPRGDHLRHFFCVQIPWRGVIFSEKALMRLRHEFYRPTDPAKKFQEIAGGLNKFSYSEFVKCALHAGFRFVYLSINPSYRRVKPLYFLSNILSRIPGIQNYFVEYVYAVMEKAD